MNVSMVFKKKSLIPSTFFHSMSDEPQIKRPESNQPMPSHAKLVFKGVVFDVYQWEQEMFDGSTATFEKLKRPDAVVVVPITEAAEIIMLEEEQPGKNPFLGLPGGRIEEGENPMDAAKRELLEETGCVTEDWGLWKAVQPTSKIDWAIYFFIAKRCTKLKEQRLDPGERIKLKYLPFSDFLEVVTNDRFPETDLVLEVLRAKTDPKKMQGLKDLFA